MEYQDVSPHLEKLATEFNYKEPPQFLLKLQDLIGYVLRAVADLLKQFKIFLPGMTDTSAVGNAVQIAVMLIGAVCVIAILLVMSSRMKQLKLEAQIARRGALSLEEILDSAGWKLKAEEYAGERLFKEACRALYMSIIYALDEKQVLSFAPTRTNYEYWYALAGKESIQRGFRRMADLVEIMWFGNHEASQKDYDDCLALAGGLEKDIAGLADAAEVKST